MSAERGIIALMGSGELTSTMVEVHKEILGRVPEPHRAVFIDTPAGFQLNVDQISANAVAYFDARVRHPLQVASFKSTDRNTEYEAEQAFHQLRNADYVLIGPGSPTYTVRHMHQTPIPDILVDRIRSGGCLVAASAAALTVGRFTLPVYEIYKVGEPLHWAEGLDILGRFGLNLVVIPHWNNAEGGTHDTRRCFMGEARFQQLEALLPEEHLVVGLDEHTACLIDLERQEAAVRGIGRVVIRYGENERVFRKGDVFPVDVLRGPLRDGARIPETAAPSSDAVQPPLESDFWDRIHHIRTAFHAGLDNGDAASVTGALLELDSAVWRGKQELESEEFISQAREVLRDLIVELGTRFGQPSMDRAECLAPLVESLLDLRKRFRDDKQFAEADRIRDSIQKHDIIIEDTPEGTRWKIK